MAPPLHSSIVSWVSPHPFCRTTKFSAQTVLSGNAALHMQAPSTHDSVMAHGGAAARLTPQESNQVGRPSKHFFSASGVHFVPIGAALTSTSNTARHHFIWCAPDRSNIRISKACSRQPIDTNCQVFICSTPLWHYPFSLIRMGDALQRAVTSSDVVHLLSSET